MHPSPAQTNDTERESVSPGDSTSRGGPMRRRNPAACLHCRKRKIRCNAGEVDVCDKCRAHNKQCIVLSVTCEEVIRSYHFEPENMSFDELWNLIQGLVQNGDLNHSDPPHILSNYQTLNPTAPMRVVPTPFPPSPLSPSYTTIQPNPSQHMPSYHIPRVNQPPHAYSTVIPGHSNSRTTENLRALGVPGVNHYPPASFSGASMRHGNYPTHAGQGILPFGGQANHLPYGDQMPRGYPADDKAGHKATSFDT